MFDIFEQYWTLLIAAVMALIILWIIRSIAPGKVRWRLWLVPAGLAVAAFACDFLVKTDLEKVNALIAVCMIAVEEENVAGIDAAISPDYSDSYHTTKEHLMRYCRMMLSAPLVKKNKKRGSTIELSVPQATVILAVLTTFEEQSFIYKNFKPTLRTKIQLHLQKQPDKSWLISRAEVLEIDRQRVDWRQIR